MGKTLNLVLSAAVAAVSATPMASWAEPPAKPASVAAKPVPVASASAATRKDSKEPGAKTSKSGVVQFDALTIETQKEGPSVIFIDNWTPATKSDFADEAKSELDQVFMDIRSLSRSFDTQTRQAPDVRQIEHESKDQQVKRNLLSLDIGRTRDGNRAVTVQRE